MFENVIGVADARAALESDIRSSTLPPAILLAGARYGAKGTIALEIARALTCHQSGAWGCECASCLRQRTLQHQATLLTGARSFAPDIRAAFGAYDREPRTGTRYLLIRAIRRMTRRFDPWMWDERRIKQIAPAIASVESALEEFEQIESGTKAEKSYLAGIEKQIPKILGSIPHDLLPVGVVRAIASWTHTTGADGVRVVIVEEAHAIGDAARNAMLKILEEPPENVYFILTSTRASAIIPTVLSRVRRYDLPQRTIAEQRDVQQRIFRVDHPSVDTLRDFFLSHRAETYGRYAALAQMVLSGAVDIAELRSAIRDVVADGDARENAQYLLEIIAEIARGRLDGADAGTIETIRRIRSIVETAWERIDRRNMNPLMTIQSIAIQLAQEAPVARCAVS
jgi:DNA polymerase-3 subunit gamma/tau